MNRKLRRLRISSWHDFLLIGVPALLLLAAGFWLAAQFVRPAPPSQLVLSTGSEGGGYQRFAARYKDILARNGIELVERPSAGALENLQRLRDLDSGIDAAFIQAGTASLDDMATEDLVSLGGLYHEPLWIFYRRSLAKTATGGKLTRLRELRGQRIAIGALGSGSHKLALDLLGANGLTDNGVTVLLPQDGPGLLAAFQQNQLDAALVIGPLQSAAVWSLLFSEDVALMSLDQAEAYHRLFPQLQRLTLPRGSIDLMRDIPREDVQMLAPTATLVVRENLHPALVDLLLQAASEVHGEAGIFQQPHEFPKATEMDFPLAPEAQRYYKSGKTFLQRYLPFWLATLVDRTVVLLVPVIALLIPIARFAPPLYGWRVRRRIYQRYGELKFLERELEEHPERHDRAAWLARLDEIEDAASHLPTPLAFAHLRYTLRQHIALVRAEIQKQTRE